MSISAKIGIYAYCPSHVQFFKNQGRWYARGSVTPQAGDVIFFTTDGKSAAHVGLVKSCSGGIVYTIEGNTRSGTVLVANGGGCFEKSYYLTSTYILGYGRPAYAAGEAAKVIAAALAEVGYLEKSRAAYQKDPTVLDRKTDGAGTDNYTKFGRWYDQAANGGRSAFICAEWCDMFVSWCGAAADGTAGGGTEPVQKVTKYFSTPKTYRNGSTDEPCYADTGLTERTGSLNPYETCICTAIVKGVYKVEYDKDGTAERKVGFVAYAGGVTA